MVNNNLQELINKAEQLSKMTSSNLILMKSDTGWNVYTQSQSSKVECDLLSIKESATTFESLELALTQFINYSDVNGEGKSSKKTIIGPQFYRLDTPMSRHLEQNRQYRERLNQGTNRRR
jgi:hypothetical protein